jgi:hypothetical protein
MTLQQWATNGWLRSHKTSVKEIANLVAIVDRDLVDASEGISPDWLLALLITPLSNFVLSFFMHRAFGQKDNFSTIGRFSLYPSSLVRITKRTRSIWRRAGRKETSLNTTTWVELQRLMRMNSLVS